MHANLEGEENMAIDPVCKMEVNENAPRLLFVFDNETVLFCSEGCRAEFKRRPNDYLMAAAPCCDPPAEEEKRNV